MYISPLRISSGITSSESIGSFYTTYLDSSVKKSIWFWSKIVYEP